MFTHKYAFLLLKTVLSLYLHVLPPPIIRITRCKSQHNGGDGPIILCLMGVARGVGPLIPSPAFLHDLLSLIQKLQSLWVFGRFALYIGMVIDIEIAWDRQKVKIVFDYLKASLGYLSSIKILATPVSIDRNCSARLRDPLGSPYFEVCSSYTLLRPRPRGDYSCPR